MNVETDLMSVDPVEAEIKQARAEFLTSLGRKLSDLAKDYFNSDYSVAEWMTRRDRLIASQLDTAVKLGVEDIVSNNHFDFKPLSGPFFGGRRRWKNEARANF